MEATHERIEGQESAPGVFNVGWLPDVKVFPELTQLREDYLRIWEEWHEAGAAERAVMDRQEAAKAERERAMRDAVLAGAPPPKDKTATIAQELAQAHERSQACASALIEVINHAIDVVVEHREEWLDKLNRAEAGFVVEAEELQKRLLKVLARKGSLARLDHWVDRTSGMALDTPALHLPYLNIPQPTSADPREAARELQERMEQSYAGDSTRISDSESRQREADAQRPPEMNPDELVNQDA
jgi:hypothetical protein